MMAQIILRFMIIFYLLFCQLQNILLQILREPTMGHNTSCLTTTSQIVKHHSITHDTRKKINPLHYIKPIHFQPEDAPFTTNDFERGVTSLEDEKENVNNEIKGRIQDDQDKSKVDVSNPVTSEELEHERIRVRWDKFIKMKKRVFSNDYKIINEIGRGGFGCVYKVSMKNTDIQRAAKKINKDKLKKQEHESLLAEMAIMMSLDHPNITKLYQVYDQKGSYIMVMELCEGGELFQKIVNRTIRQVEAKSIIKQVLNALHYLHEKGIVHRDIKPQNMLFEKKTKLVKIIDFGISTRITPGGYLTSRVGTPYYIAPEVLFRKYNQKCDLWSLGVVLYMIIYNYPPFKGQDAIKVMQNILKDEVSFKSTIKLRFSNDGIEFLKSLLNKDLNNRPNAKEALEHQWLKQKKRTSKTLMMKAQKEEVLQRISHFHFKNKLQAVVHTYIVSQLLTSEERLQLLDVFRELDENQNGIIDSQQIRIALLNKRFTQINEAKIQKIIAYIDTNCSGHIDYTQFLVAALDFDKKVNQKHLEQAFAYFDIDNSGEITFEEVAKFLENELSRQQVKNMFMSIDKNGDGVISKTQFIQLLLDHKHFDNL